MATPWIQNRHFLQGTVTDLGTADVTLIACPVTGHVTNMWVTNEVALTTADEDLTLSTVTAAGSATAVTGGVLTIPTSGSGALETTELGEITRGATTQVTAGGSIRIVNDGASTSAGRAFITGEVQT